ncbi:MAG: RHS repeat-associated core domain-containing protein, partial [Candidatus Methanofastidiosia archaeon]
NGNLTSLTDANGNTTYYQHDSLFGVTQIVHPDSTTKEFSYDEFGNLLQKTDSSGITTFTYNAIYQVQSVQYPDQSSVTFEYDPNGNRTLMVDEEGTTTSTFDNRNRLLSETRTIEGAPYTVSYTYNAASRLMSTTYPDQSIITNEYDALNRLVAIPGYAEFAYDENSLLDTMIYNNGVMTSYQYDNCNRILNIQAQQNNEDILLLNYQYDLVGNITLVNYDRRLPDQQWAESVETFQYDWLDRLISAEGDYGSLSYSYDPVGNRLSQNDLLYTYNTMNELLSISDGATITYDAKGNMLTKSDGVDTWSYTYDVRDLLTQVEKNQQVIAQYTYDGHGNKIKKTEWIESFEEFQTLIYVYSGTKVIYEKNLDTGIQATYIYGPNGKISKKVNGLKDYYHADHLGSTRLITDESGNTVTDITYNPFGESVATGEEDPYLYNGKEKDSTGLYYYGARYYDPELGRFITRDIAKGDIENPQTMNLYSYCLNNPMKYTDPLGFSAEDIVRDIFNNIFDIDPETLGEDLEKLINKAGGDVLKVLEDLFSIMGFEGHIEEFFVDADTTRKGLVIKLEMDGEDYGSITIFEADLGSGIFGLYNSSEIQPTVKIDFDQCTTVAEVITIALHEICHHVLGKEYEEMNTKEQHYYIYKVQIETQNEVKKVAENPYSLKWSIIMGMKWFECYWLPEKLK